MHQWFYKSQEFSSGFPRANNASSLLEFPRESEKSAGFHWEAQLHMYKILRWQGFTLAQSLLIASQYISITRATLSKTALPLCGSVPTYPWCRHIDWQLQWFKLRKYLATTLNFKHLVSPTASDLHWELSLVDVYAIEMTISQKAPPTQTMYTTLFTQHIFRELISSSSTCLLSYIPKWPGQYLHMVRHIHSAMELPSTELDRTTHATLPFPEKVRSGSTSHSVTFHSRDNKASFL